MGEHTTFKSILMLFELIARLKVNFHKSILVGVNVSKYWLEEVARVFKYLGILIRRNLRKKSFWESIIGRTRGRLSRWWNRNLLFDGCLVLLKVILVALLIYFFSFFRFHVGIISKIESILKVVCVLMWVDEG